MIKTHLFAAVLSCFVAAIVIPSVWAGTDEPSAETIDANGPISPIGTQPALDPRRIVLGEALFRDKLLSSKQMLSCTSCHSLATGGTVRSKRTIGYNGRLHRFNAPSIFNVGLNYRLGWRGDFTSLEEQNEAVLLDKNLMAITWPDLIARLEANPDYKIAFDKAYGRAIARDDVLNALATYERSLVTPDAPFDQYLKGDTSAISRQAKHGYSIFKSLGCASCHQGMNIGGNLFQKFGVFQTGENIRRPVSEGDLGRWTTTHLERDRGVFRVPSLRNVEVTSPYFHDGRISSLKEAVLLMGQMQLEEDISESDADDLVAFLKSLTGRYNGRSLSSD